MAHDPDERLLGAARGGREIGLDGPDADELAAARRAGDAARTGLQLGALEAPPEGLWESIANAAGVETAVAAPGRARNRARWWTAAAAAAAAIVVVIAVGFTRHRSGDTVVERIALRELSAGSKGSAQLVRHAGTLELRVDADVPAQAGHYYELWLLNRKVTGLVSLGPLQSGHLYPLHRGLQLGNFPLVDVSVEQEDGNPAHSGVSVLRGDMGRVTMRV